MVFDYISNFANYIKGILFAEILGIPLLVLIVIGSAVYLMLLTRFANVRSWAVLYQESKAKKVSKKKGEVSAIGAFMSAAGSTLGIGNIVGGAIAVKIGGAGSLLWIVIFAFLLSMIKFSEVCLGLLYRTEDKDKVITGGPFYYIGKGFSEIGKKNIGKILAIAYAVFFILAYTAAGGFQLNQISSLLAHSIFKTGNPDLAGHIIAIICFAILMGGIHLVAKVSEKLVPIMALVHIGLSVYMFYQNADYIGHIITQIFNEAFNPNSQIGSVAFVAAYSLQRILFASDAGTGSAAIANSNSSATILKQSAIVSFEPLLVGLMMILSGMIVLLSVRNLGAIEQDGIHIISSAFENAGSFVAILFFINLTIFGFTSIISNGYASEKAFYFLSRGRYIKTSRMVYSVMIACFVGLSFDKIMPIADIGFNMVILINIISLVVLGKVIKSEIKL